MRDLTIALRALHMAARDLMWERAEWTEYVGHNPNYSSSPVDTALIINAWWAEAEEAINGEQTETTT